MRILRVLCAVAFASPFAPASTAAEKPPPVAGVLRNHLGEPLPSVTIRAYRRTAPGWQVLSTQTRTDGTFSFSVPRDRWVVMADADELVARGYFCVPGWIGFEDPSCPIDVLPVGVPISPLTCGQLGDPILFEAVPTRPEISVSKEHGKEPVLHLTYPWTTLPMRLVRQYTIEKSVDMVCWEPVSTVSLDGYGRVDLPVPGSSADSFCMFRAVEAPPTILDTIELEISPVVGMR